MQISQATPEELGLIITGLRAIYVSDAEKTRARLQQQVEQELSTRYGMVIREPGSPGATLPLRSTMRTPA